VGVCSVGDCLMASITADRVDKRYPVVFYLLGLWTYLFFGIPALIALCIIGFQRDSGGSLVGTYAQTIAPSSFHPLDRNRPGDQQQQPQIISKASYDTESTYHGPESQKTEEEELPNNPGSHSDHSCASGTSHTPTSPYFVPSSLPSAWYKAQKGRPGS